MKQTINSFLKLAGPAGVGSIPSIEGETVDSAECVVRVIWAAIRQGIIGPGQSFPPAEGLAQLTGESEATCTEVVSELLRGGILKQNLSGDLVVTGVTPPRL